MGRIRLNVREYDQKDNPGDKDPNGVGISPCRSFGVRETEDEAEKPARHKKQTREVHRISIDSVITCQPEQSTRCRDGGEKQIDEERPAPGRVGRQDAAEEQSEGAACASDGSINPERLSPLIRAGEGSR